MKCSRVGVLLLVLLLVRERFERNLGLSNCGGGGGDDAGLKVSVTAFGGGIIRFTFANFLVASIDSERLSIQPRLCS
jgi:hypothetical protein